MLNSSFSFSARYCPHVEELRLSNFRVDVSSLERLCRGCPRITTLFLPPYGQHCIIETVFRGLPKLRSLSLHTKDVTERCLSLLPTGLQQLALLGPLDNLDADVGQAPPCLSLKDLDLEGLYGKPADVLAELLTIFPRLERLLATGIMQDDFLKGLPEKVPGLRHLRLRC